MYQALIVYITIGGDIILKVDDVVEVNNIQDIFRYTENEKRIGDTIWWIIFLGWNGANINVKLDANPAFLPPKIEE